MSSCPICSVIVSRIERLAEDSDSDTLPNIFDRDSNSDGQIAMHEYASQWNDGLIKEFFEFDLNSDGVITLAEAREAIEQGARAGAGGSTMASRTSDASSESSTTSAAPSKSASPAPATGPVDPKMVKYAKRIIDRYDKNKDGALTMGERTNMLMNIDPADADRDGGITIEEYARYMQARSKR